jgi:L-ribulose-5-phosphate 3-epimerase
MVPAAVTELHVVQGRLLPPHDDRIQAFPVHRWAEEFPRARQAGVTGIEWVYDVAAEHVNPIVSPQGVEGIRALSARHGVAVESMVCDWFRDRPLLRATSRVDRLRRLFDCAAGAGVRRIVIPFIERAELRGQEDRDALVAILGSIADDLPAELHLETSLPPDEYAELLRNVEHPMIKVNYDTGDSASRGYDPQEEFDAYWERIGSIHIKDRALRGPTVPLGHGAADLPRSLGLIRARQWERPLVLQVARGVPGTEVEKTAADASYVRKLWDGAA